MEKALNYNTPIWKAKAGYLSQLPAYLELYLSTYLSFLS